jgi:hypothetical protein
MRGASQGDRFARGARRERAEAFLKEFGMVRAARTKTALHMRGTDPAHHIHVTELGESRFLSFAFAVSDPDDLRRVATLPGASAIESIDEPGGGRRLRLTDPDKHGVEVVFGIEAVPALPVARQALNLGASRPHNGELQRPPRGASQVKRIGHGVLMTSDLPRLVAWYRDTLGFLTSDEVHAGTPGKLVGSFNRLDRGETFVDHHVFFCIQGKKNGPNHLSFEVQDIDDVMIGHSHLRRRATPMYGVSVATTSAVTSSITGRTPGAACTNTGPIPTRSTRPPCPAYAQPTISTDRGRIRSRARSWTTHQSDGTDWDIC